MVGGLIATLSPTLAGVDTNVSFTPFHFRLDMITLGRERSPLRAAAAKGPGPPYQRDKACIAVVLGWSIGYLG